MAYVTMLYSESKPIMSTIHAMLNVNGQAIGGGLSLSGSKFTFEMNNGQTWRMWTSESVTVDFKVNGFNFASEFSSPFFARKLAEKTPTRFRKQCLTTDLFIN